MRYGIGWVALACALVLFTGVGATGFLDVREARDAQVARELLAARELITPVFGSTPWIEKPILAYAPEVAVRSATPAPEIASRVVRALLALALVIVTGSVGAMHFGMRAGTCAALVLATTLALPLAARADGTQVLVTLLGWLGAAALGDAMFVDRAGRGMRLVLGYAALASALMCGGVLPAAWPVLAALLFARLERRGLERRLHLGAGLALIAGLALPWHVAMLERHGGDFLARLPFFPYATNPLGAWLARPVTMLSFLVVGLFPWSVLLPGALLHAATGWRRGGPAPALERTQEEREERAAHYFVACLAVALATLLVYPTPPLSAVLPVAPAAALLCGRLLDHLFADAARVARPLARATLMLALTGTIGAVLLAVLGARLRDLGAELRVIATALFATSWAPALTHLLGRRTLAAVLLALPVAVGTPLVTTRLLPAMEDWWSTRPVAEALERAAPPLATLVLLEPAPPTLRFYGEHNLVVARALEGAVREHRASDGATYLAFRPLREREVARAVDAPLEILLRTPALVLARVTPDGGP